MRTKTMPTIWLLAILVSAPALAGAQEKPKEGAPEPVHIAPPAGAEGDPHQEMERLMGEVERKMHKVNRLLEEASSGRPRAAAAQGELKETIDAIDKLLRQSEEASRSAVSDIDRILELSTHPHPGGT
jgi:hypothetical protein